MSEADIKIYYFTGTGNSLYVSREVAGHFYNPDLISIASLMTGDRKIIIEGNRIGFVFPVYFARPPVFIRRFIENCEFSDTQYIFAVATGGGLFGNALKIFNGYLRAKGKGLDAGFLIKMPGNHPAIADLQRRHHNVFFEKATARIHEITEMLKRKTSSGIETNFGIMGYLMSHFAFSQLYKKSVNNELDNEFHSDESCDACGICVKCCPVSNISLSNGKPVWHNKCVNCSACYHFCPKEAIQLGKYHMTRYHHPSVSVEDLFR